MSDDTAFGLELILCAHSKYFKRKSDVLTCLIHWKLLTDGQLRCVGTGEIFSVSNASNEHPPSEILREEAFFKESNGKAEAGIAIKYRGYGDKKTCKYLLKLHEMDPETLLVNLIRISDEKVITLKFDPNQQIICDPYQNTLDFSNVFIDLKGLITKIDKEIVETLFPKPSLPSDNNKVDRGTGIQAPRPPPHHPGHVPPHFPRPHYPRIHDPMGRGDLEPFFNDGGGMFMDPFGGTRRRDPSFPNFDPPVPGMRGRGFL